VISLNSFDTSIEIPRASLHNNAPRCLMYYCRCVSPNTFAQSSTVPLGWVYIEIVIPCAGRVLVPRLAALSMDCFALLKMNRRNGGGLNEQWCPNPGGSRGHRISMAPSKDPRKQHEKVGLVRFAK